MGKKEEYKLKNEQFLQNLRTEEGVKELAAGVLYRILESGQENGKDYSCYFVYKESHKMDSKEFAHLVDGAIEEAKELGIQTDTPEQLARYKEEWSK